MDYRLGARFCRRCRARIADISTAFPHGRSSDVNFVAIEGSFRRPPLALHDIAYALDVQGRLVATTLRARARSKVVAAMPAGVGVNRAALVNVAVMGKARPGWCLLAVHPGGVEAVVLATGDVKRLHTPGSGAELAVNAQGAGAGFRGVVSDGDLLAFAERGGSGGLSLALRYLADDRPAEYPFSLSGENVVGPVLCDGVLGICSEQELGVFDVRSRRSLQVRLPRPFEAMLARRQGGINVPPGSVPLTLRRTSEGVVAYVAGTDNDVPGLLGIEMEGGSVRFEALPRNASVSSNSDGTLCVAAEDEVRVVGGSQTAKDRTVVQAGLPAAFEGSCLMSFGEERRVGWQRLRLTDVHGTGATELRFEDPACKESSCCAPVMTSTGVAVPYFVPGQESGYGLKLAVWNFARLIA